MDSYFDVVVASLTIEDTRVLGVLVSADATAKVKAMINKSAMDGANLSEALFRKVSTRLVALKFIEISTDYKEHAVYATPYGHAALSAVLQTMVTSASEVGASV